MTETSWRADPLEWGHGPRVFEVFLEPTCPFSVRAFGKLDTLLAEAGQDRITIKLRLQSQPWHMYSGVVTRCVIAASTLPAGSAVEGAHCLQVTQLAIVRDRHDRARRRAGAGGDQLAVHRRDARQAGWREAGADRVRRRQSLRQSGRRQPENQQDCTC